MVKAYLTPTHTHAHSHPHTHTAIIVCDGAPAAVSLRLKKEDYNFGCILSRISDDQNNRRGMEEEGDEGEVEIGRAHV